MRGDEQRVWSVHAENRLESVWLKKRGPRNRVPSFRSDEDRDKRPRREQPVNTARGFISPPPSHPSLPSFPPPPVPLVLRHPVLSIFCRASSFRSSLLSFAPSSLLPFVGLRRAADHSYQHNYKLGSRLSVSLTSLHPSRRNTRSLSRPGETFLFFFRSLSSCSNALIPAPHRYTIHFVSSDDFARYAAAHSPDVPSITRNSEICFPTSHAPFSSPLHSFPPYAFPRDRALNHR